MRLLNPTTRCVLDVLGGKASVLGVFGLDDITTHGVTERYPTDILPLGGTHPFVAGGVVYDSPRVPTAAMWASGVVDSLIR